MPSLVFRVFRPFVRLSALLQGAAMTLTAVGAQAQPADPASEPPRAPTDARSEAQPAEPLAQSPESPTATASPVAETARPSSSPSSTAVEERSPGPGSAPRFIARVFAGGGFAFYQARRDSDAGGHLFSDALAAGSMGAILLRKPVGALSVSGEALVAHSLEGSLGAHAAGNLLAAGVVLGAHFDQVEICLGGYVVSRTSAARELGLTESRLNGGVGAGFYKDFRVAEHFSWGIGLRALMLPNSSYEDADGKKHVHFSDGLAVLGISVGWQ